MKLYVDFCCSGAVGILLALTARAVEMNAAANHAVDENAALLAVHVIGAMTGDNERADDLRPMLEMEIMRQWQGGSVERTELPSLMAEYERILANASGAADGAAAPGKLAQPQYILTVRISSTNAMATAAAFPSAKVIHERNYTEQLAPLSLSQHIAADALKSIRLTARDPQRPTVALGAFVGEDPHKRLYGFVYEAEQRLRDKLTGAPDLKLAERLFPSQLLTEYELSRGGLAAHIEKHLAAPPADILFHGTFAQCADQPLDSTNVFFEFTLRLLFPTGAAPPRETVFTCRNDRMDLLADYAAGLLRDAATAIRGYRPAGAFPRLAADESALFKQQGFSMLPLPPDQDGVYFTGGSWRPWHASEHGLFDRYERALRLLECAWMLDDADSNVLVCMGVALYGMSRQRPEIEGIRHALFERAWRRDNNWNTRGFYAACAAEGHPAFAGTLWENRHSGEWHPHQIHAALLTLLNHEPDFRRRLDLFFEALPDVWTGRCGNQGYRLNNILKIFQPCLKQIAACDKSAPEINQAAAAVDILIGDNAPFVRVLGHMLGMAVCANKANPPPSPELANRYTSHVRAAVELLAAMDGIYTDQEVDRVWIPMELEFRSVFNTTYPAMAQAAGAPDDSADLRARFNQALHPAAPPPVPPAGDGLTPDTPLRPEQLISIPFNDGLPGAVGRMVNSPAGIFGLRHDAHYHSQVREIVHLFRLPPGGEQAEIINLIPPNACLRDLDYAGGLVGIGSDGNGFYLIAATNAGTPEVMQFTPDNSGLPGPRAWMVCAVEDDFLLGIAGSDSQSTYIYRLNPRQRIIADTPGRLYAIFGHWRLKANIPGTDAWPVVPQTEYYRTAAAAKGRLLFTREKLRDGNFVATVCLLPDDGPHIIEAQGRSLRLANTDPQAGAFAPLSDARGLDILFRHRGIELENTHDMAAWQNEIIFATETGLYAAAPGAGAALRRVVTGIAGRMLCATETDLYIGAASGLYRLDARMFAEQRQPQ